MIMSHRLNGNGLAALLAASLAVAGCDGEDGAQGPAGPSGPPGQGGGGSSNLLSFTPSAR